MELRSKKEELKSESACVVCVFVCFFSLHLLIKDQVWSKVEHGAVGECVGPPAQGEHHHPHPRQLDH